MPSSSQPFRRSGANSWQEFIDKVNERLENPPENQGCEPIDPITVSPNTNHIWSKSDIQEVIDKLNEMPRDCFSFETIPDLWKVSIIENIENQLSESWCDCGLCCYECTNCGRGNETLVAYSFSCGNPFETGGGCAVNVAQSYGQAVNDYLEAKSEYRQISLDYCAAYFELKTLNNELFNLEQEVRLLQSQKDILDILLAQANAISCAPGPAGLACEEQKQTLIDDLTSQIAAKQAEIDAKQAEIDIQQVQVDEKQSETDTLRIEKDNASDDVLARGQDVTVRALAADGNCAQWWPSPLPVRSEPTRGCDNANSDLNRLENELDRLQVVKSNLETAKSECGPGQEGNVCREIKDVEIALAQDEIDAKQEQIDTQQEEVDIECSAPALALDGGDGRCREIGEGCCHSPAAGYCGVGWGVGMSNTIITQVGERRRGITLTGGEYNIDGSIVVLNINCCGPTAFLNCNEDFCELCFELSGTGVITRNHSGPSCHSPFICETGDPCGDPPT